MHPTPADPPTTTHLDLAVEGPVARVSLARPAVLDALSVELLEELERLCRWLGERDDLRVVVRAGQGRAFSAGADRSRLARPTATDGTARAAAAAGDRAASAIEALPQVTVAQLHGRCVVGGVVLALACDLRVAAAGTRVSIPEVDLGIPLAWGGIPRLLREAGPGLARDLVLTCRGFDASDARAAGLVPRVVADEELEAEVAALADPESRAAGQRYLERVFGAAAAPGPAREHPDGGDPHG